MPYEISLGGGERHPVAVTRRGEAGVVYIDGRPHAASLRPDGDGWALTVEGRSERVWIAATADEVHIHAAGRAWTLSVIDPIERAHAAAGEDAASAPMPGTVVSVAVEAGEEVTAGQPLMVIESMKMQSELVAPRAGTIERVSVGAGDTFDRGAELVSLVSPGPEE